ncbi:MAG: OmpH family outer membrane protein [Limnochordales bacterium]|nr:MAG: hypothetical protein DIU83_06250 [Bacillota bacterium]
MKRRIVVATLFGLALVLALGAVGSAQSRIGVIDLAYVLDESKAGQEGNAILQAALAERREQVQAMEQRLQELEASLTDATLSDEERDRRLAELEAAAAEYNETVARFEAELDFLLQTLRDQILSDIGVILQMIAEERGLDIVIDASQAHYYRDAVDLTLAVIQRYDELYEAAQDAEN